MEFYLSAITLKYIINSFIKIQPEVAIVIVPNTSKVCFVVTTSDSRLFWEITDVNLTDYNTNECYTYVIDINKLNKVIQSLNNSEVKVSIRDESTFHMSYERNIRDCMIQRKDGTTKSMRGLNQLFEVSTKLVDITNITYYKTYKQDLSGIKSMKIYTIFDIKDLEKLINLCIDIKTTLKFIVKDNVMEITSSNIDTKFSMSNKLCFKTDFKIKRTLPIETLTLIKVYKCCCTKIYIEVVAYNEDYCLRINPFDTEFSTDLLLLFPA